MVRMRACQLLPLLVVGALACGNGHGTATVGGKGLSGTITFSAAGNHVPRDLVVAIAAVEGGLTMPKTRDVDPDAQVPVAGPLELRHGKLDTLARGAALMGTTELELRRDTDLALEAGVRVLAELGVESGATEADLASWEPALEAMSGMSDAPHRSQYAHRVFALLARGGKLPARDGEVIELSPHDLPPSLTLEIDLAIHTEGGAEYPGAEWFPTDCTNKCDTTRGGNPVDTIVIHDTEGGWAASVATLQNDPGKSVQYIVDTDGHVGQFVPESYTAWHAGNYYYNQHSVGIEHVGYYKQPYPTAQYEASAKLVDYLASKYKVARDRTHVVGHDQVPNGNVMPESSPPCEEAPATCESGSSYGGAGNHRDPGDWEWCTYMPRFGGACKCNDIWNLWNCSSDHTQAFRCSAGKVELETCDGPGACESMPLGQDDVCHQAPPGADAGSGGSDSGSGLPPPVLHDAGDTPPSDSAAAADGGGCNASGGGTGTLGLVVITALATAFTKRRRARKTI